MYKLSFPFLLVVFLFAGSSLKAQTSEFLSQLKTIITTGEKGQMATLKGGLAESTRDREEQHRVYSCLQPLTGFDINFSEKETYFSLFVVARSAESAKILMDALLNDETRERSGINGYTVNRENESVTKNVSLQKAGSAVKMTLYEPDSKILIAFTIQVMKTAVPATVKTIAPPVVNKTVPPVPVKTSIKKTPLFLEQLKTILEAASKGMASHKVKLVYTKEDGTKNYTCDLKLEGFNTYVVDDGDGLHFLAAADDWKLSTVNANKFNDKKQREEAGITGYTTTFRLLGPAHILNADEETSFHKSGDMLLIYVYKNCFDRGSRIEIKEVRME